MLPFAWCGKRRVDRRVSNALSQLAEPVIDAAPARPSQTQLDHLFLIAALVWNASIECGGDEDALEERLDAIASELSHIGDARRLRKLAAWLSERKRREFPGERRRITGIEAWWHNRSIQVRAASAG